MFFSITLAKNFNEIKLIYNKLNKFIKCQRKSEPETERKGL